MPVDPNTRAIDALHSHQFQRSPHIHIFKVSNELQMACSDQELGEERVGEHIAAACDIIGVPQFILGQGDRNEILLRRVVHVIFGVSPARSHVDPVSRSRGRRDLIQKPMKEWVIHHTIGVCFENILHGET